MGSCNSDHKEGKPEMEGEGLGMVLGRPSALCATALRGWGGPQMFWIKPGA